MDTDAINLRSRWVSALGSVGRLWLGLCFLVPASAMGQGAGESLTVRYFQQLRERRLFSVAEQLGMDRLADPLITPEESIQISVELSKTYAEHARFTSGDEHDQYWQFAESAVDEALEKHGRHPRGLLLEAQKAFIPALRGEFLRGQVEVFPYDEALEKQTDEVFRTALERLKPLESKVAQRQRQLSFQGPPGRGDLASFELHDLHDEARFRLGSALLEFAKTKDRLSPERITMLRESYQWLNVLAEGPPGGPFKTPAKLRLAENHRLRDDLGGAETVLKEAQDDGVPKEWEAAFVAERVRWMMAKGQLTEAHSLLSAFRPAGGQDTGELAFLKVQILLTQWEAADIAQDAAKSQLLSEQIETLIPSLESELGGYWLFRVSQLRDRLKDSQKYGTKVAAVVKRAESQYASENLNAAAADYQQAADMAQKIGKDEVAFDLGFTRASILVKTKEYEEAESAFQKLATDFPENERAPQAELLAAYCLGKRYEADPTQVLRESYTNRLKEHIQKHPGHETSGDAYWMLGQLEERRLQITQAITYYRNVPQAHRLGQAAQLAVARCYEKVINRLHEMEATAEDDQKPAIKKRTLEFEQLGAKELGQFVLAFPQPPAPFSSAQADVALQLARLQIARTEPDYQAADDVLKRILESGKSWQGQSSEGDEAEWPRILKTSRQLRIVSLAGQGLSHEAESLVKELSQSSTQDVLGVMDGLMLLAREADALTRRNLGQLQLQTANELNTRRSELDEATQDRLDHCRAQAYLATGQPKEAVKLYDELLARQPKSKALFLKIAGLLEEANDPAGLEKAKELWQAREAQEKTGSLSWLESRYEIARISAKLGQNAECRKLISQTKAQYPQLGNEELRTKFLELEQAERSKR